MYMAHRERIASWKFARSPSGSDCTAGNIACLMKMVAPTAVIAARMCSHRDTTMIQSSSGKGFSRNRELRETAGQSGDSAAGCGNRKCGGQFCPSSA
jgi:hypothetical protein